MNRPSFLKPLAMMLLIGCVCHRLFAAPPAHKTVVLPPPLPSFILSNGVPAGGLPYDHENFYSADINGTQWTFLNSVPVATNQIAAVSPVFTQPYGTTNVYVGAMTNSVIGLESDYGNEVTNAIPFPLTNTIPPPPGMGIIRQP